MNDNFNVHIPVNHYTIFYIVGSRGERLYWTGAIWSKRKILARRIAYSEIRDERDLARLLGNYIIDDHHVHEEFAQLSLEHNHDVLFIQED